MNIALKMLFILGNENSSNDIISLVNFEENVNEFFSLFDRNKGGS